MANNSVMHKIMLACFLFMWLFCLFYLCGHTVEKPCFDFILRIKLKLLTYYQSLVYRTRTHTFPYHSGIITNGNFLLIWKTWAWIWFSSCTFCGFLVFFLFFLFISLCLWLYLKNTLNFCTVTQNYCTILSPVCSVHSTQRATRAQQWLKVMIEITC